MAEYRFGGRGTGKTTEAIKQAHKTGAYMIVAHAQEADRVMRQAEQMGLNIRYPVTFDEFRDNRMSGSRVRNVVVDNGDWLLEYLLGPLKLEFVTFNMPEPAAKEAEQEGKA